MARLLKEWDVVCRSLEEGRQILLARKGGILDEDGLFAPAYPEFFLFPTFLHQSEQIREALKPSELIRLEDLGEPRRGGAIPIRLFCRMTDSLFVTDPSKLEALDKDHIWNRNFLRRRFEWGSVRGLTLLIVKVYRLDKEVVLPRSSAYAGCRSWIEVGKKALAVPALSPVLSDDAFLRKRRSLLQKLSRFPRHSSRYGS